MAKNTSKLIMLVFPLGFLGAIASSYSMKISGTNYGNIGIGAGVLIGSVTTLCLVGFFIFVHVKLFPIPEDLFSGPMFGKTAPMFSGNPSIFRQGLACALCLSGSGFGLLLSNTLFRTNTLGVGMSSLLPGIAGSILLIGLWRKLYK